MRYKILSMIVVALAVISGCKGKALSPDVIRSEQALDSTLVTLDPCAPPCWFNIVPGVTTKTEVMSRLQQLAFVDISSIFVDSAGNMSWRKISDSDSATGGIVFSDDVVESINIRRITYSPTIGDLVDSLGPPEGTWVGYVHQPQADISVIMIWPNKGVRVVSQTIQYDDALTRQQLLTPDTLVSFVEYFVPFDSVYTRYSEGQLKTFQKWSTLSDLTLPK